MNVEIVTIGDELLLGDTVDMNSVWLSRELGQDGVSVTRRTTVGDSAADIADVVRGALERCGAVITTGGLGPTSDDRSRPAVAGVFGQELIHDDAIWESMRSRWRERGHPGEPPESNRVQAQVPRGATVLLNRRGTAPGLLLQDDRGRWCAMLPGVPGEMRGIALEELLPRIRVMNGGARRVVRSLTLRTTGVAESRLTEIIEEHADGFGDASLAYLPGPDGVDLRITVRDRTPDEADRILRQHADELRARLGEAWYGDDSTDLAAVVLERCRARKRRLAVAESCTGGLLGARITAIPGSSDVFRGGVIAYANDVKTRQLGVEPELLERVGAVSEEVARAMALGVRRTLDADIGIGITGVAGPEGGSEEKPVGLVWIAVALGTETVASGVRFFGERNEIRMRSAQAALNLVRKRLGPDSQATQ